MHNFYHRIFINFVADNVCCSGMLPEPLTSNLPVAESTVRSKSPPSSFTPVSSIRRHKRCKLDSTRLSNTNLDFVENKDHSPDNKLLHPSVRYNSFPHTSTLFSLFLNSPLLPPSTQWLYSQLYPNPYSTFQLKNSTFENIGIKEDEESKNDKSESPLRKSSPSPNDYCKTSVKNASSKQTDVWRPY